MEAIFLPNKIVQEPPILTFRVLELAILKLGKLLTTTTLIKSNQMLIIPVNKPMITLIPLLKKVISVKLQLKAFPFKML